MGENLGSEVAGTDLYGVQMPLNVGASVGLPWRWDANTLGAALQVVGMGGCSR